MNRLIIYIFLILSIAISSNAQEYIEMRKEPSGIYTIPCEVNGLKLRFILDTGASAVGISLTEASFMLKNGYLDESDIIGSTNVRTADGNIAENYTINLKSIKIGSVCLNNVEAVVSNGLDAPLLLGQSVLDKLGHWSIDNSTLIINDIPSSEDPSEYSYEQLEQMLKTDQKDLALKILRNSIQNGEDYASYVFLSNVADAGTDKNILLQDQDVIKAMSILEATTTKGADDTYCNYEKIIWFSLYRLLDKDKALRYFRKIESKNILSVSALDALAENIMLASGWGLDYSIDDAIAKEFYYKGYYSAYTRYASYLKDIKNKPTLGFNAFKKSSEKGNNEATYELAMCSINGEGTNINIQLGLSLLNKAANNGWSRAISELCSIYYHGTIVKEDFNKVIEYVRLFGEQPHQRLLYNGFLGIAYWGKKEYRMALQYMEEVTAFEAQTEMSAKLQWVSAYNYGLNEIYTEILYAIGQSYENGLGCKLDFAKAFDCYTKLTEYNPGWGYSSLGDMFFFNELIEQDAESAYKYYLLGANNDSGYCYLMLSQLNYYGDYTQQNIPKAMDYKKKAIELGIPSSCFSY